MSILFAKSWTRSLTAVWKSASKMPWLSVQPMSWEIRSSLKKRQLNLAGSLLSLLSKPSWKRCANNRFIYVNLGSIEAQLSKQDQIPGEVFASHDRIEVFVYKVEDNPRGVNVFVSRSHPEMIKRLMEQEIPEVYDGTVEIMSVSREAGDRTKVAVRSHNPNVDAIGTIVGRGGANIKKITSKFHPAKYDAKSGRMIPTEENIDVIEWVVDPAEYIYNAIAPAKVDQVIFHAEDNKRALVVVPDNKLSLAIGRRGQNVRLAAHLTGFRIDIKSASEFEAMEAANELGGFGQDYVAEEVPAEVDVSSAEFEAEELADGTEVATEIELEESEAVATE